MDSKEVEHFFEEILPVVLEAGEHARASQGRVKNIGKDNSDSFPSDTDFITEQRTAKTIVDEEVQEKLLKGAYPLIGSKVRVDAEEDTPSVRLFQEHTAEVTLVIDPIDGTLEYIQGRNDYSICLALLSRGTVLFALVYFPKQMTMYLLDTDGKSYRCEYKNLQMTHKTLLQPPAAVRSGTLYVSFRVPERAKQNLSKKFITIPDNDGTVSWPEAFLKCLAGEYEAVVLAKPQIRDVLLGAILERVSGGYATDFTGGKLVWPDGGRIPEVIFGFGTPAQEVRDGLGI